MCLYRTYTKNVKERLNVAKRLFEQFDTDHSGYLVEKEIPALLKETYNMMGVAYTPTQEDVRSWMQMADKNGRGKVSLEDYEQLIITSLESCGIKIYDRD